ncbi:hypothetical protein H9P43_006873 [Blastocladiella emersonii ATCC 22665]|nr:hypothetical protein H9P43_006873 [Blastocladiella emersonii ATCC 22665]
MFFTKSDDGPAPYHAHPGHALISLITESMTQVSCHVFREILGALFTHVPKFAMAVDELATSFGMGYLKVHFLLDNRFEIPIQRFTNVLAFVAIHLFDPDLLRVLEDPRFGLDTAQLVRDVAANHEQFYETLEVTRASPERMWAVLDWLLARGWTSKPLCIAHKLSRPGHPPMLLANAIQRYPRQTFFGAHVPLSYGHLR